MLKSKEIKKLKSLANTLDIKYQIGKGEIDDKVITLLNNALKSHELIKISFNKNIKSEIDDFTNKIIKSTNSEFVSKIGRTIIIYKENKDKKDKIVL